MNIRFGKDKYVLSLHLVVVSIVQLDGLLYVPRRNWVHYCNSAQNKPLSICYAVKQPIGNQTCAISSCNDDVAIVMLGEVVQKCAF
jgi:hypothetical protein